MKTISKIAVAAAVIGAAAVAARRYNLVDKGRALAETSIEKAATGAEWFTAKAAEVADIALTKADEVLTKYDLAADPTDDESTEKSWEEDRTAHRSAGIRFGDKTDGDN